MHYTRFLWSLFQDHFDFIAYRAYGIQDIPANGNTIHFCDLYGLFKRQAVHTKMCNREQLGLLVITTYFTENLSKYLQCGHPYVLHK